MAPFADACRAGVDETVIMAVAGGSPRLKR